LPKTGHGGDELHGPRRHGGPGACLAHLTRERRDQTRGKLSVAVAGLARSRSEGRSARSAKGVGNCEPKAAQGRTNTRRLVRHTVATWTSANLIPHAIGHTVAVGCARLRAAHIGTPSTVGRASRVVGGRGIHTIVARRTVGGTLPRRRHTAAVSGHRAHVRCSALRVIPGQGIAGDGRGNSELREKKTQLHLK